MIFPSCHLNAGTVLFSFNQFGFSVKSFVKMKEYRIFLWFYFGDVSFFYLF